jgi:predicted Zn-dependent protease
MKTVLLGWLILWLMAAGCAAPIRHFTRTSEISPETEGERRLWSAAEKIDVSLRKSGQIYEDEVLRGYVQSVLDKLYPEFKGKMVVHLLRAPILNAFVLPNGSIYVNLGLIATMENEAQLASVLGHEGVHFLQKHSALQRERFHQAAGISLAISMLGIPFVGDLAAISSIFGYSRELEREADRLGFEHLASGGYDVKEGARAFEHLAREAKANKTKEPFFFSTHPRLEERIASFKELAREAQGGGAVGKEVYQDHVGPLRPMVLEAKIDLGKYDAVIAALTTPELLPMYPEPSLYFLGEAYRLRNGDGDLQRSIEAYRTVQGTSPEYAPVYKSLGLVHLKMERLDDAKTCFEKYLALDPQGDDAGFVVMYLEEIRNKRN